MGSLLQALLNSSYDFGYTIIIILIIILITRWKILRNRLVKSVNKFSGPPGWPIIGNTVDLIINHEKLFDVFKGWTENWPKCFRLWLGHKPVIFIFNANDVETVLSSSILIDKGTFYDFLQPWLGTGLLTSTGRKWQIRRKFLTPAFHFQILDDSIPVFNEHCDILLEILKEKTNESSFDIYPLITRCTLDIICESVMGVKVNAQINSESDYIKALEKIKDIIHSRQLRIHMHPNFLFKILPSGREHDKCLKILHDFTTNVIAERKESLNYKTKDESISGHEKKKRLAFLDLLLQSSAKENFLSDSDIREEVDTFMFEGHDTTAVGISWTLFLLGNNPDIQKKVQEELDSIFGNDETRHASLDDLKRMKYLELVIKESQRIFPSVPLIARIVTADTKIDDKIVPPGVLLIISPYFLHRDEAVFPDPYKFDPDRFQLHNTTTRSPFAYIPFSAGPRNCIGQKYAMLKLKIILARILRSFTITSLEAQDEIIFAAELVTVPMYGIKVHLEPRNEID